MNYIKIFVLFYLVMFYGCSAMNSGQRTENLKIIVAETEKSFAASMAERNFEKFCSFVSEEAVFFSQNPPLRGKKEVTDWWKKFFVKPEAPFSWKPETVEVLESGKLALTSGPVYNPENKLIGTFTSVWRLDDDGKWRIVFDKGNDVCEEKK